MKKCLIEKRTRVEVGVSRKIEVFERVRALKKIGALLIPVWDLFTRLWPLMSSSYLTEILAGRLTQELCQAQDSRTIIKE